MASASYLLEHPFLEGHHFFSGLLVLLPHGGQLVRLVLRSHNQTPVGRVLHLIEMEVYHACFHEDVSNVTIDE